VPLVLSLVDTLVMVDVVAVVDVVVGVEAGIREVDVDPVVETEVDVDVISVVLPTVLVSMDVAVSVPCGIADTENTKRSRVIGADNFIMV